ncbi:helix-turn-helix domain-containing protein [Mycolicibacterium iranicum]|uniref:Transcriptional regulator n=1 Tax=Mycolicibacterium iranicum TaxID=912594 RepID=A0A178LTU8_MYCIR|nr:helix-turn-helix domain-containing protein [Mycolicibacterium iranicum]OAN36843.1 transcriptional regulator [Mycolicibacterium iranicum]
MRGSSSAPTERVVDIVELLSQPRNRRMRFSDIADELGQTQGTVHAILKTLTDRGWVTRDPTTKSFELGPMVSLIAASLETSRPLAHVAREAARRLSRELHMPVSVVEVAGDELLITAFESPAHNPLREAVTDRIPYLPPFGVAFAAWDTTEAQRDWVARGSAGDTDLARRLRAVLARTRDRGYDVDWMTPALAQIAYALGAISTDTLPAGLRPIIDQLRVELTAGIADEEITDDDRTVATISAPVLDDTGHTRLILGVHPMLSMSTPDIDHVAQQLLGEICTTVSNTRD